jgi:hypothetical protein
MGKALLLSRVRAALTTPGIGQWTAWTAPRPSSMRPVPIERDLRLDFFRGLSLFFIFIDHIPNNILAYGTVRVIAFSDAAEVFIFISGYTAALVYGQWLTRRGPFFASVQIYHRVWQLYVAHIFTFVIYTAEVSYATLKLQTQTLTEELRLNDFLEHPHIAIIKMLLLQYQPQFLDILPLYIVLLAVFPAILLLQYRRPLVPLILSLAIYLLTLYFGWEPQTYPTGDGWFFNPFAWQFLFVVGATAGYAYGVGIPLLPRWPWVTRAAIALALVIAVIKLSWIAHQINDAFPGLFLEELEELADDKSDLSALRLLSFFALTLATVHFVKRDSGFLRNPIAGVVIRCGQHSLQVFCLGIMLSVFARFIINATSKGIAMQLAVNIVGIGLMIALAQLLSWYKRRSRAAAQSATPQASAAG